MILNTKCNSCQEPTKYVAGFWDGKHGKHGCIYACKNEDCFINQLRAEMHTEAVQARMKIQQLNAQNKMFAGFIAAMRKEAKVTMKKMSEIAGCTPAEYSAYENEQKEFDPAAYKKCEKFLKQKVGWRGC